MDSRSSSLSSSGQCTHVCFTDIASVVKSIIDAIALSKYAGTVIPNAPEMIAHMRQQTDASSMNDICASLMLMVIALRKTSLDKASTQATLNM
jgi:uncharacterized membrane protein